jgi:hypothetical protein
MLVNVMVLMGEGQVRGSSTTLNKRCLVSKNSPHAATDNDTETELTLSATLTLQCNCCEPSHANYGGPQPSLIREASARSRCVCWNVARYREAQCGAAGRQPTDTSIQTTQVAVSLARRWVSAWLLLPWPPVQPTLSALRTPITLTGSVL